MLEKEEWVLIRVISKKLKEGVSISEIARQTGHDRKTIRKYLSSQQEPKYSTVTRESKLDPYKEYIKTRLNDVPGLTTQRIVREIKEKGYTGSRSILSEFIRPLRKQSANEAVVRFETMPGYTEPQKMFLLRD